MTRSLSIVLVDDEPMVRQGLRTILESEPDLSVVGEAANGAEAVTVVRQLRPDVVCMDVRMPEVNGIRATELILRLPEPPRVLVITTFENDDYVYDALGVGAAGFLLKRASADTVIAAVRTVAANDALVFPEAIRRLAISRRPGTGGAPRYKGRALTPRETEVLALIARGLTNAEIAAALVLGVETIRTHVSGVLAKLGARDRTQAVVIAYTSGLVPLD